VPTHKITKERNPKSKKGCATPSVAQSLSEEGDEKLKKRRFFISLQPSGLAYADRPVSAAAGDL